MRHLRLLFITSLALFIMPDNLFAQLPCKPSFQFNSNSIEHFALHTMQNLFSGRPLNGYTAYPDSVFTTTLNIGRRYPVTIMYPSLSGTYGPFAIWIDYNDDSVFSTSEQVYIDSVSKHQSIGFIQIPNDNSLIGKKRMRVLSTGYTPSLTPCGTYRGGGEVEDYVITIADNIPDTPTYCVPVLPPGSVNFFIDTFRLNTLDNSGSGTSHSGYTHYAPSVYSTTLVIGQSYTAYLSKDDFRGNDGDFSIWIDLNDDREFSTNERLVYSGITNGWMYSATLTIPLGTTGTGIRRMRVVSAWPGSGAPCGLLRGGEIEDYDVTITDKLAIPTTGADIPATLFPNPASDHFYVSFPASRYSFLEVTLYDVMGQCVSGSSIIRTAHDGIDISRLSPGVYNVMIKADGQVRWLRFTKM